ncbi:unnamed protein product [Polarella glacialis]|uniref:Uncharacterized protein n=1 Tax=Polarella glacialis TaxID=89957 RepID=A0A813EY27_POLGL|nr:unnamed protein product [Polarella glacialis]CAE8658742.1 unnamed protein product [Polarella glacialis]
MPSALRPCSTGDATLRQLQRLGPGPVDEQEVRRILAPELSGPWRRTPKLSTALLSSLAKQAQSDLCCQVLCLMQTERLCVDLIHYNVATRACRRGGRWQRALEILGQMREMSIQPDDITYGTVISVCQAAGHWQLALSLLSTMLGSKITPDVISYSATISSCEKGGQWQPALDLLCEMRAGRLFCLSIY